MNQSEWESRNSEVLEVLPPSFIGMRERVFGLQRRLLRQHMLWPIFAPLMLGLIASFMVSPDYQGPWLVLVVLTVAGGFLKVRTAAVLGMLCFISYGAWLFWTQLQQTVKGSDLILLISMPFAPLWLAAMRAREQKLMHLGALLTLPQVRAAIDISTWSLLPSARALDTRLRETAAAEIVVPALLIRLYLNDLSQAIELLGEQAVRSEVMLLANLLREDLRGGDLIAEDLRNHGSLFVLVFLSRRALVGPDTILRRLKPALESTELNVILQYALVPEDGMRMCSVTWHDCIEAQRS